LLIFVCCLAWAAVAAVAPSNNTVNTPEPAGIRCGYVYDGDKLIYDVDYQVSTTSMSANWFGFDTPTNPAVRYEWCIVSEKLATEEFRVDAKRRCRSSAGFEKPDILDWTDANLETSGMVDTLSLEVDHRYFVVVRASLQSGDVFISNSDGVKIVPSKAQASQAEKGEAPATATATATATKAVEAAAPSEEARRVARAVEETEQAACPIDVANLCRAGKVNVGEFLTELYGPPVFVRDPLIDSNVDVLYSIQSHAESGLTSSEKAGIIVACIVILLLILLPLYCLKPKGKENKFQTNPNRTENIENI